MTEQHKDAGAAKSEKDKTVTRDFLILARQATTDRRERIKTYVTDCLEEVAAARIKKDITVTQDFLILARQATKCVRECITNIHDRTA